MKIKDIIQLSKTDSLAKIAKEHLNVGKEKAREGLKLAGCYSVNGVRGWHFDGDESVLDQSIYDFVTTTRKAKPSPKTRNNTSTKAGNNTSKKTSTKTSTIAGNKPVTEPALSEVATSLETSINTSTSTDTNTSFKTSTKTGTKTGTNTDILDRLYAGIDPVDDKKEVSFYLTHDVIEVINRTKKGYRSDLVNEALRKVFKEKGWL